MSTLDLFTDRDTKPEKPEPTPTSGTCPCCKQRIRPLNPHRMCSAKVAVLCALADLARFGWVKVDHGKELRGCVLGDDGNWEPTGTVVATAYRAEAHVGRLKWFGLVDHAGHRTGRYRINERGRAFLAGRLCVPEVIFCRDGEVVERSATQVTISEVKDVVLDAAYWDAYGGEQRRAVAL